MTREEKKYFAKLEKASKNNPMVRVEAAADFINRFLTQAFTTPRGINGDGLCYLLSALTGVAVADISKKMSLADMLNGSFSSQMELDTEAGKFIVGDTINKYLYNSPMSAINIVEFMYSQKNGKDNLPDLENMIKENADNFGNPDYRVFHPLPVLRRESSEDYDDIFIMVMDNEYVSVVIDLSLIHI